MAHLTIGKVTDPLPCCIGLPILFFRQCPSLLLEDVSKNLRGPAVFGMKRLLERWWTYFLSPVLGKDLFAKLGWVDKLLPHAVNPGRSWTRRRNASMMPFHHHVPFLDSLAQESQRPQRDCLLRQQLLKSSHDFDLHVTGCHATSWHTGSTIYLEGLIILLQRSWTHHMANESVTTLAILIQCPRTWNRGEMRRSILPISKMQTRFQFTKTKLYKRPTTQPCQPHATTCLACNDMSDISLGSCDPRRQSKQTDFQLEKCLPTRHW